MVEHSLHGCCAATARSDLWPLGTAVLAKEVVLVRTAGMNSPPSLLLWILTVRFEVWGGLSDYSGLGHRPRSFRGWEPKK